MNTIKTWIGCALIISGASLLGACSGDDDDGEAAAGAGAGTSGGSGASGGSGNGASHADPNQPAAPGVFPTFIPSFPGAGTSGDDAPLTNGELCDYVPLNGAPTPEEITTCFFADGDPDPAATMEQVLECVDGADVVHIRLTFNPTFVDNTYGENAIGWKDEDSAMEPEMPPMMMGGMMKPPKMHGAQGHAWKDLTGSDHAQISLRDEDGKTVMEFKLDYISEDPSAPSGYASLGVSGGDGQMITGDAAWLLDYQTSIAKNLNERGYASYTTDSPATDEDYTPNPDAPEWDYRYVFEAWIDVAAFGSAGFGTAIIESVHASPSKASSNTIEVMPGECPPCHPGQPCTPDDECDPTQPDVDCDPGHPPDGGIPGEPDAGNPPSDGVCDGSELDVDCNPGEPPDAGCHEDPNNPEGEPICSPI